MLTNIFSSLKEFINSAKNKSKKGLFVAILGPDGSGKSTVLHHLAQNIQGKFTQVSYFHWRPGLLPPLNNLLKPGAPVQVGPCTEPHKFPPHGFFISFIRLVYYTLDFILGYWVKFFPRKVRSGLILVDRYYYDFLVDPRRFRLNVPRWIVKVLLRFVCKPDLVFYLDAPVEILLNRKQELSAKELNRQRTAFLKLLPELHNGYTVDASRSLEYVTYEVERRIVQYLELSNLIKEPNG